MEIKRVPTSEIHWSIGWNASQQANSRLKDVIGDTSKYFALLKVGNATYNWIVDTVGQWRPMGMAPDSDKPLIMEKAEEIKQEVIAKLPGDNTLASKICQVPNYEEYIFYREAEDGNLDVVITGWGFHNFKKAGPFMDTWPPRPKMFTTSIAFIINGERQPNRPFFIITPKMKKPDVTDAEGLRSFKEYAGLTLTVIDEETQRRFDFTTAENNTMLEFDVTVEEPVVEEPVVEEKPQPVIARITVLDAQGLPIREAQFKLSQGEKSIEGTLDELGTATFEKDTFTAGQPLSLQLTTADQQQIEPIEFTLDANENEYILQQNAPKGGSRLLEVIAFILLLGALAALLIFAFKPGIEELTKLINKNIF